MTERTPKMSTIRHAWAKGHPFPLTTDVEERYAEFDRALAAHDAEVRAGAVAEEPEWEYGTRCPMPECTEPHLLDESDAPPQPEESLWRRTRERHVPPGEWAPVKREGKTE